MKMTNLISSWFSSNNNYNQTNIETQNNYSSEIKTLLESIDGYFDDGKIIDAFNLLNSAIEEHKHKESKYALIIKKVEYFLELRNIEEAIKYLKLLEKKYNEYINTLAKIKYKNEITDIILRSKKNKKVIP